PRLCRQGLIVTTSTDPMAIPGQVGGRRRRWRAAYEADPIGFLTACRDRWGDVFTLEDGLVVVCDPEMAHRVLMGTNRESVFDADLLDGNKPPSTEEIERSMQVRTLMSQILTPKAIRGQLPRLEQAVHAGVRRLAGMQRFDPVAVAQEVCVRAALPIYLDNPSPGLVPALVASDRATQTLIAAAVHLPWWWPSPMRRRILRTRRELRAELLPLFTPNPTTSQSHRDRTDQPTLLDRLHTAAVPTDLAMQTLGNALLSGIPAMSGAWCWVMHHLATRPDHVARIRAEAADQSGPNRELPYTTAFVRETLRTHPAAWMLGRDTIIPTAITDHFTVPTGTGIMISPYLIHHDHRYWPDPDRFDPNRWLSPHPAHHRHAYLPFGVGPRVCVGMYLGQLLLTLTAAHIATHYRLTVTTPATAPSFVSLLLPTGLTLNLTPRA
ncbi:MAG: cytochrome P450, partial [Actinomycetota bacterium]|nr:cytochrome P450 [Actinomycetota bacterium]